MKLETSLELLERVRARLGNVSYYRVAKILEVNENTVSNWKVGRSGIAREYAPRIAELLGESPEYILACIESEREPDAGVRRIWKRIAEAFRSKAAIILIGALGLSPAPSPVQAQTVARDGQELSAGALYIMRTRKRLARRRLADRLLGWLLWTPRPATAWGRV